MTFVQNAFTIGGTTMEKIIRPETMERITTKELADAFIAEQVAEIRAQVGDKKVLLALSGGVDSSVVAALLIKAIGKQLVCVHVNHGLLRKGEPEQVVQVFRDEMDANLVYVDAIDRFLGLLEGVAEPEKKRKIIGAEFIRVFEEEARKLEGIEFLAQGTIYPDITESDGVKAHHNVGGLPEDMQFELVEPVKLLYKDEVRVVGEDGKPAGWFCIDAKTGEYRAKDFVTGKKYSNRPKDKGDCDGELPKHVVDLFKKRADNGMAIAKKLSMNMANSQSNDKSKIR